MNWLDRHDWLIAPLVVVGLVFALFGAVTVIGLLWAYMLWLAKVLS